MSNRALVAGSRRVVIKVGSSVLASEEGLLGERFEALAQEIARQKQAGRTIVLVSSGAVAAGRQKLGLAPGKLSVPQSQAAAAAGQSALVVAWEKAFAQVGEKVAQVLLVADDLSSRARYLNARNTLLTLLDWGVIPVINENDTVAYAELQFGDNDQLAVRIGPMVEADLVILLTDTEAVYDADPRQNPAARPFPELSAVTPELLAAVGQTPGKFGRGGMRSKLIAAQRALEAGIPLLVLSGQSSDYLAQALQGAEIGTLFASPQHRYQGKKLWLAHLPAARGSLEVDDGAVLALQKGGSLLPVGITKVLGSFQAGDPVYAAAPDGRQIAIGLVNYPASAIERIRGHHSEEIEALLGYRHSDEVIHRDNLALL